MADSAVKKASISAGVFAAPTLTRTAPRATSGAIPIASSVALGSVLATIGLTIPVPLSEWPGLLHEAMDRNRLGNDRTDAYLRITVSRGAGEIGLDPALCPTPTVVIMAKPLHPPADELWPTPWGDSIGHWEGDTLVVDTVGVHPQTYITISEAAGVPNNGDMTIKERIHLDPKNKDTLVFEMEITAPKVLTKPWKTTRLWHRQRAQKYDIIEGTCLEGYFRPTKDKWGNEVFERIEHDVGGNRIPPK